MVLLYFWAEGSFVQLAMVARELLPVTMRMQTIRAKRSVEELNQCVNLSIGFIP